MKGTAMGTKMAPTYAALTLGYLEEILYKKIENLWHDDLHVYIKENWKRYLDDCFIIWEQNHEHLLEFHNILNNLDPSLQFTIEFDKKSIPFLDVLVKKTDCNIDTDIYYKPTDTHQYLHFNSCHPRHTKRAIPYNLSRRICTIVSDPSTRNQRLEEMRIFLHRQMYPRKLIEDGIRKAKLLDRTELINPNRTIAKQEEIIPFVTTHNPNNNDISLITHNLNRLLREDKSTTNIFGNKTFINSKRQASNLKRILCPSSYNQNTSNTSVISKCNDKRCGTCKYIIEGNDPQLESNNNFNSIGINESMTCASSNLIYVLKCSKCPEYYVGETGNTLRTRVRVHKQQITDDNYRHMKVSKHIHCCGKDNFSIMPIHKMSSNSNVTSRKHKEQQFLQLLCPSLNAD